MVVSVGFTTTLPPAAETGTTVLFWLLLISTEYASVTLTVSVLLPPSATVVGFAVMEAVVVCAYAVAASALAAATIKQIFVKEKIAEGIPAIRM
jgi:hypothetical protein